MDALLHRLFADAAAVWPRSIAICHGDVTLTYADCDRRVASLAAALPTVAPDGGPIALNLAKSPEAIIAMLACLRAGVAYVPIDPLAPLARRRVILEDCGARAIVLDERSVADWRSRPDALDGLAVISPTPAGSTGPWHSLEALQTRWESEPPASVDDDAIAYVLYTSGSTGTPKGVEITYGNAAAFVSWGSEAFPLRPDDQVAVHAPLHFDLPVFDVFVGFAAGATLHLVDQRTAMFPAALLRFLSAHRVTVLYAVPTAYVGLVQQAGLTPTSLPDLRLALYAGEEFHPAPLRQLMDNLPGAEVHNLYGPVETNVVTAHHVTAVDLDRPRIPIGQPVDHARILLLDADGAIAAPGEQGEIVVAGPSVSPGYLGDPERTARTRVRIPVGDEQLTCYRTGDFGRWGDDGALQFLGRGDGLVKTRGFRVEIGDVEATLVRHPDVALAVVVPVDHPAHSKVLRAVIVPRPGATLDGAEVTRWCREELPSYMVPVSIDVRDDLPRTSTGKADRAALRAQLDPAPVGVGSP